MRKHYDFKRFHCSVLRTLQRNNVKIEYKTNRKKKHSVIYHTPKMVGEKWKIDVKYVPKECVSIQNNYNRYYQYTILDECSRKRFLCYCKEHSMYETVKALIVE